MCALLASESRHLDSLYFLAGKVSCIIHIRHWDWNGEIVIQSVPSPVGGSACKDLLFLINPSQGCRFPLNAFSPLSYPVTWRSFLQVFLLLLLLFFVYNIFFQFPVFCENCSMCQHISDVVLGEVSSVSSYSTYKSTSPPFTFLKLFIFYWSI